MADSQIHVALAGNPNCGKTTLFNLITGANGYVGNWPGVTVEKKEAKLLADKSVTITDLPGIYSLSPYSPEEQCSRDYLLSGEPDVAIQVIDATNLERNLYLALQVIETGLPVVAALNMCDLVEKNGDKIDVDKLSARLGCPVVMISALKNKGIDKLFEEAKRVAGTKGNTGVQKFDAAIEDVLTHIENLLPDSISAEKRRFFAVKLFERDEAICKLVNLTKDNAERVEQLIAQCEKDCDDDAESIITGERYGVIAHIVDECLVKAPAKMSTSEKIDRVVTNRFLGLPIFVVIMFAVYYIAVTTLGGTVTDFTNDQLFGEDGWFLLGQGREAYDEAAGEYEDAQSALGAFAAELVEQGIDGEDFDNAVLDGDLDTAKTELAKLEKSNPEIEGITTSYEVEDEDSGETSNVDVTFADVEDALKISEPEASDYGTFVPGITTIVKDALVNGGADEDSLVVSLVCDGIVAGLGAIFGFVPQMFLLFVMLTFLENCGYMARVAFIMDRIFRRFGLSGKSFIPMLVSSGCGVPGVMATKTIENEKDRRMTVMTTTFIPCGAKLPIIALLMGSLIGDTTAGWISPMFYFLGVFAVIASGMMLKKTKMFAGRPTPFVMELPAYHFPALRSWALHVWERCWAFIKKAGTVIFASTVVVWFLSNFGAVNGQFGFLPSLTDAEEYMDYSVLAMLGNLIAWIFAPLGFNTWQACALTVSGLVAKENVVATAGSLLSLGSEVSETDASLWTAFAGMFPTMGACVAFGAFNLLCAPCFAAMGTIRNQMNSGKWTAIAIGYECGFAWCVGLIINQFYSAIALGQLSIWTVVAIAIFAAMLIQIFRPMPKFAWTDEDETNVHSVVTE